MPYLYSVHYGYRSANNKQRNALKTVEVEYISVDGIALHGNSIETEVFKYKWIA